MPRLFSAIEIPKDVSQSLSLLHGGLLGTRWVEAVDYHITLNFFGDIENDIADELVAAFDKIECSPFTLQLKGIDVFGSKKPHSLYAHVYPSDELNMLQEKMARIGKRLGIVLDKRRFIPHVTIARLKDVKLFELLNYLSSRGNFSSGPFQVNRFVLMSSKQSTGGGPYIVEDNWPLAKHSTIL